MAEPGYVFKDLSNREYYSGSGRVELQNLVGIQFNQNFLSTYHALLSSILDDTGNVHIVSNDSCPKGTCDAAVEARHGHRAVLSHIPPLLSSALYCQMPMSSRSSGKIRGLPREGGI